MLELSWQCWVKCCAVITAVAYMESNMLSLVTSHLLILFNVLVVICEPAHSGAGAVTDCNCNLL